MKYRPEIDGLRSVAVLPVILFHAGYSFFSGGYVGVDVFFVISGYLITTILIDEREKGTYSLLGFYERRARRILPALFLVLICTIPFAWRWIPPDPFEDYARSLSYAAMFISNIHFLEKSSYFDVGAEFRPLLHTWSLAVEEQYYLLFPLVLWVQGSFMRRKFLIVFLLLSALSIGLAEWGWRNYPTENFFFSPSRLWELLAGSICAAILFNRAQMRNDVLALAGLLMIAGCVVFYNEAVPFPSVYTIVPVLGTALIILFADKTTLTARFLSLSPLVGIGLISYSAYLWHQPLFAFARIRSVNEPSTLLMSSLALASLVLAYLTWRFVETPFRRRVILSKRNKLLSASAIGIVLFAGFGTWGDETKGFPIRVQESTPGLLTALRAQVAERWPQNTCKNEKTDPEQGLCVLYEADAPVTSVAVLGDSHAQSLLPAFKELPRSHGVNVLRGVRAACPPLLGVYLVSGGADALICHNVAQKMAKQVVRRNVDAVFIAARWSLYATGDYSGENTPFALTLTPGTRLQSDEDRRVNFEAALDQTVAFYREAGLRVILVAQVPQQWVLPDNVVLQSMLQSLDDEQSRQKIRTSFVERERFHELTSYADSVLAKMADKYGAEILSLNDFFVDGEAYAWFRDDVALYRDSDHLSIEGALAVSPLVVEHYMHR
ncbi:acyltransferase family protein [Roseovarius aestuarii]|uniref:O-acetyltransferase OatA n=1 Tax=Roseovarius aestuarii TaxID=475083 RepID=A0A1X7BNL8_9RHOB|nr:acyltransferase family protein [Roseovarius aestuarii]SMC11181.1 O-acetyltransferase OatA [Roseovarius aestuarii]